MPGRNLKARFAAVVGQAAWAFQDVECRHRKDFSIEAKSDGLIGEGVIHTCDKCGKEFESRIFGPRYNTPSGELEPGCLYWATYLDEHFYWDNHSGSHLCAVLPNGFHWTIDSRASNCGSPQDKLHRCWVRHGEPPNITVDKNGLTCSAGAGSIIGGDWHGFLQNGFFIEC